MFKSPFMNSLMNALVPSPQVFEACSIAWSKGDHHLASVLAQAASGEDATRQLLAQQLATWAEAGSDALMAPTRLSLFALAAGQPTHRASHSLVNVCQGLAWTRCLALLMWYVCPATATVAECLAAYEAAAALSGNGGEATAYAAPPFASRGGGGGGGNGQRRWDVAYHLLKLYCDPMHSMAQVLAACGHDAMDVALAWMLWRVLVALGHHHLSSQVASSLHLAMGAQLESRGQWGWAAFVLLHLEDGEQRAAEVRALVQRHAAAEGEAPLEVPDEQEEFVVRVGVPRRWLHEAKAVLARRHHRTEDEAWQLLRCGTGSGGGGTTTAAPHQEAHALLCRTIAPHAIINEDHAFLGRLLQAFDGDAVSEWGVGGQVYADYLGVTEAVAEMKQTHKATEAHLEALRPKLMSLCGSLNRLKCPTGVHRLAVAEMSRVVVGVMRVVLDHAQDATEVLATRVASLPLTHDYALHELNLLTENYLRHLTHA